MAKKTAKKPAAPTAVPKVAAKENNTSKPSKKALRKALAAQKAQLLQKKNTKEQSKVEGQENAIVIAPVRKSDEPLVQTQASKWINKQRLMVVASRGITYRDRHLMNNLKTMLPHSKSEPKMDTKDPNIALNEMCEIRNCNKAIFFENRRRQDLYMWIGNVPSGPTAKFLVENIHNMGELRLPGNSLKSSRPLLSFDPLFDSAPHYALLKELLVQTFGVPNGHPKSQPFFDHVLTFTILDHRIWFRNYQIVAEDGSLAEIGPRFDLNLIKIFEGSFGGRVLYSNPHYVAPQKHRLAIKRAASEKYKDRQEAKKAKELRKPADGEVYADVDKFDDVFETIRPEEAVGQEKLVFKRKK